jgi:hypothetical protein
MSQRIQENIVAGVLLCIFVSYIAITLGFGPNAQLVPLPIASLGLIFLVIQLIRQNLRDPKELQIDLLSSLTGRIASEHEASEQKPTNKTSDKFQRELTAIAFVTLFVGLIVLLGPIVAVLIFSTGFFLSTRHFTLGKALVVGTGFTLILYVLFVIGLQLQLYHGVLQSFIPQ